MEKFSRLIKLLRKRLERFSEKEKAQRLKWNHFHQLWGLQSLFNLGYWTTKCLGKIWEWRFEAFYWQMLQAELWKAYSDTNQAFRLHYFSYISSWTEADEFSPTSFFLPFWFQNFPDSFSCFTISINLQNNETLSSLAYWSEFFLCVQACGEMKKKMRNERIEILHVGGRAFTKLCELRNFFWE